MGSPIQDPIKKIDKRGMIRGDLTAEPLWTLQTPQTFRLDVLRKAYAAAAKQRKTVQDSTEALALIGQDVRLVDPKRPNFRIRTPDDLMIAVALLF